MRRSRRLVGCEPARNARAGIRNRDVTPEFVPNLELNARFYQQVVEPLVARGPTARPGSDGVPRCSASTPNARPITGGGRASWCSSTPTMSSRHASRSTTGCPKPSTAGRCASDGTVSRRASRGRHHARRLADRHIGCDATAGMSAVDWLMAPQQHLLGVTRGAVYRDDTGALTAVRDAAAVVPRRGRPLDARVPVATRRAGRTLRRTDRGGRRRARVPPRRRPPRTRVDAAALPARGRVLAVLEVVRLRVPRAPRERPSSCRARGGHCGHDLRGTRVGARQRRTKRSQRCTTRPR